MISPNCLDLKPLEEFQNQKNQLKVLNRKPPV